MKTLKPLQLNRPLRRWQELAMRRYYALNKPDFLLTATPGSGKTFVALLIVYHLLLEGSIERIVIVTPTEHLKRQWAEAAVLLGIDIDCTWANASGRESSDYFGVAVTYHQVGFAPDLYDLNCRKRTLVIFDEIHHAGDSLDWGIKLRQAFRNAERRLSLSGTPFRSDAHPIPFVSYQDNKSRADFSYGYGAALADGVCRPIYFPTVEGNASWIRPDGVEMNCSMLDALSPQKSGERLRTALDAGGEWLPEVLREADSLLTKMRLDGHADAAGLVIALDQFHARKIAHLLKVITNETLTVAISDEDDSSREIHRFAERGNHKRWIVAVRMISEGVDIPRLRVGVYATTILSELFFRQAVGRFVRMIPDLEEQSAALFLPYDARLVRHALSIKDEREHTLTEKIRTDEGSEAAAAAAATGDSLADGATTGNGLTTPGSFGTADELGEAERQGEADLTDQSPEGGADRATDETTLDSAFQTPNSGGGSQPSGATTETNRKFIVPLFSHARMFETVFNGDCFTTDELTRAETLSQQIGMRVPATQAAALIKLVASQFSPEPLNLQTVQSSQSGSGDGNASAAPNDADDSAATTTAATAPGSLLSDRKHRIRREINNLANRLANLQRSKPEDIHRRWIVERGGTKNNRATEAELREKYQWLKAEVIRVQQSRRPKSKMR